MKTQSCVVLFKVRTGQWPTTARLRSGSCLTALLLVATSCKSSNVEPDAAPTAASASVPVGSSLEVQPTVESNLVVESTVSEATLTVESTVSEGTLTVDYSTVRDSREMLATLNLIDSGGEPVGFFVTPDDEGSFGRYFRRSVETSEYAVPFGALTAPTGVFDVSSVPPGRYRLCVALVGSEETVCTQFVNP